MNRAAETQHLIERIRVLFGVDRCEPEPTPPNSPYASTGAADTFQVEYMPRSDVHPADPDEAANAWLNTPNPTLGGLCPKICLHGNPEQRAILDAVLSSLEDGAFS